MCFISVLILPLQVFLKKHHSLKISKGSKARLLVDFKSRKVGTNFLRKTLTELYGKEQLARMSAKGRLQDSIGISDPDLNAIWGKEFFQALQGTIC